MAITQISRIQQRKGLQVDLPRLAGAEFGWSTDTRRLFIGNGDLEEGAPVVGNTEILTEFSDIIKVNASYTYEGEAAGYIAQTGPNPDSPVTMTLQQWMDQWVTIKDFGAKGDGFTDDTVAINRAMYEIYCRDANPQVRRAIYFPAGVYRVTSAIKVPPYATLYGEGAENSIIQLSYGSDSPFVVRTADSNLQVGENIGSNGAVLPKNITISNLCIASKTATANLLLLEDVAVVRIESVGFQGPLTRTEISSDTHNIAAVRFRSKPTLITSSVVIDKCQFDGLTYAINGNDHETNGNVVVKGVTVNASTITNMYQGVVLGDRFTYDPGSTGFRITENVFDSIYAQGIFFGKVRINASAYNMFYDVGNYLLGVDNPYTPIIEFAQTDNISIGDMFARPSIRLDVIDPGNSFPAIELNNTTSIAITNSTQVEIGTYVRRSGNIATLLDATSVETLIVDEDGEPFIVNTLDTETFTVNYTLVRGSVYRSGVITVSAMGQESQPVWSDDYTENETSGIQFVVRQIDDIISVMYTSSFNFINATFSYSLQTFNY